MDAKKNAALLVSLVLWAAAINLNAQQSRSNSDAAEDKPFTLQIPVSGIEGVDWVVGQYFDHDPSAVKRDYRGGSIIVLDGHDGIDFNVPNFLWMDNEELYVFALAAADGRVVDIHDGEFDRNVSYGGQANYVIVEHANAFKTKYYHLKKDSVAVSLGQDVLAGQRLGIVGSSGYSRSPHLHFEVVNPNGSSVDPFREDLWEEAPSYDQPSFNVLDFHVFGRPVQVKGGIDAKDPTGQSITSIAPGKGVLGIVMSIGNVRKGDVIRASVRNERTEDKRSHQFSQDKGFLLVVWDFAIDKGSGTWLIEISLDGEMHYRGKRVSAILHEVEVAQASESRTRRPESPSKESDSGTDLLDLRQYRPSVLRHFDSTESEIETAITFVNDTEADISACWVNYRGRTVECGVIAPGDLATRDTYQGHLWAVKDANGEIFAVFQAERRAGRALVALHAQNN